MGGIGSGNRSQIGADTTDDYRSVDVRQLKRLGMLEDGTCSIFEWKHFGRVIGSIRVRTENRRVVLDYKSRFRIGGAWKNRHQEIDLDHTNCHLGGLRPWFRCPVRGCYRRVAILYGVDMFACRHCHGLVYASQREDAIDRSIRKAERLKVKLRQFDSVLDGMVDLKPKGMHSRTYEKIKAEYEELEGPIMARFGDYFRHL